MNIGTAIAIFFAFFLAMGAGWLLLTARQKLINKIDEKVTDWEWERIKAAKKKREEQQ